MIGPIAGPGQRETIKGGRDQDLLTPFWQGVALCVFGAWILGWLAAMALVAGPVLGYVLSLGVLCARAWRLVKRYRTVPWAWVWVNLAIHVGLAFAADLAWTSYTLPWTLWGRAWFVALCCVMIAPPAWLGYSIAVRIADPNYPSPRKAVDQKQPQMPWYKDKPAIARDNAPRLVRVQVENNGHNYHAGVLDLAPVREWYDFALWLLRHPDGFSEPNAKQHGVKVDLKSNKPPWYGRGFRQVRNDLFDRGWAEWANESAHEQGIVLYEEAVAAFHEFCEDGPPLLGEE